MYFVIFFVWITVFLVSRKVIGAKILTCTVKPVPLKNRQNKDLNEKW